MRRPAVDPNGQGKSEDAEERLVFPFEPDTRQQAERDERKQDQ